MSLFKVFFIFLFILLIQGCHSQPTLEDKLLLSNKGIIVSCVRCGCMEEVLKTYMNNPLGDQEIKIYGDQSCFPLIVNINYIQLSQRQMDSLYKSNFNIVLFKKKGKKTLYRVIQTNEASAFQSISKEYFN